MQGLGRERFSDEVDDVGRLGEARFDLVALAARDHHDHGHALQSWVRREAPANFGRVPVRDQPIQKDEVGNGGRFPHQSQAGLVVGGRGNRISRLRQRKLDDLQNRRTIVDYE